MSGNMVRCRKEELAKLQLDQNKAAHLALNYTHRTNIINMHDSLSWFTFMEKLTTSLLALLRNSCVLKMAKHLCNLFAYTPNQHTVGQKKYLVSHQLCKVSHLKKMRGPVSFIIGTLQL